MKKFVTYLKAFVPQHIKNSTIINIYGWLGKHTCLISQQTIVEHTVKNKALLACESNCFFRQKYIENQPEWSQFLFGTGRHATIAHSGCGIIAVYNALIALEEDVKSEDIVALIHAFEQKGAVLNGKLGVSPTAIYEYFAGRHYDVIRSDSRNADTINEIGKKCDVVIITSYNDGQDITAQIHTVCITKSTVQGYTLHNAYYRVNKQWKAYCAGKCTLQEAVLHINKRAAILCVIGICKHV